MKPNKITKGGEGCIIIASFGTFFYRHKYKESTQRDLCITIKVEDSKSTISWSCFT